MSNVVYVYTEFRPCFFMEMQELKILNTLFSAQGTFDHYILVLIELLGLTSLTQRLQNFLEILKFVRKTISKEDITMYNFGLLDILEIVFPHHFQGKCPYFGP